MGLKIGFGGLVGVALLLFVCKGLLFLVSAVLLVRWICVQSMCCLSCCVGFGLILRKSVCFCVLWGCRWKVDDNGEVVEQ